MTTDVNSRRTRRGIVMAALALGALGIPAIVAAAEDSSADDGPVAGVVSAQLRSAVPGLYVPDAFAPQVLPSGAMTIHTAAPCATMREVLLAGDWSRLDELQVPPEYAALFAFGGLAPLLMLQQGADRAFATLTDGADGCDAVVGRPALGPVVIEAGPVVASGDGWAVATRCLVTDDDVTIDVTVGAPGAGAAVQVVLSGTGPERQVSLSDDSDGSLSGGPIGVLDVLTTVLQASIALGDSGDGGIPPGVVPPGTSLFIVESSDGEPLGSATVEEGDGTLSGTVDLQGFAWSDQQSSDGGTGRLAFPFTCAKVSRITG